MSYFIRGILLFTVLGMFSCSSNDTTFTVMTYNIRYDNLADGINKWDNRKDELYKQVLKYSPDILGTQEGLNHQITFLDKSLSSYKRIGVGREDGRTKGEYCAIFYDTLKHKVVKEGTFWLSEKPEEVSVGWDAALERICTYGVFENHNTKKKILIMNAHFDHLGKKCRVESVKLIENKIKKLTNNKIPVVLMGDLNVLPFEEPILMLNKFLRDSKKEATIVKGTEGTFNGFKIDNIEEKRIDYVFGSPSFKTKSYITINDMCNEKYISDHFPIIVEYVLKQNH
ncbi:endonuclease/exonuclease/phosphatase family protein [Tenacibaculum xiamenense]|uniref:endonuclease/exonuclease/phosphatase family protein n=1 Tax=Tenacibaculum xiamenense TaxID=1261553 RepID=UPI0038B47175